MKIEQVLNCSFERWYPLFKHLTLKSDFIEIPNEVIRYLRSDDSSKLPKGCIEADESDDIKNNDEYESTVNQVDFPQFDKEIKKKLAKFNEKCFIKLNWSSPKDAHWCLNKLSCESLRDVYMFLCSSEFISHDLNEPFDKCNESTFQEKHDAFETLKYYLVFRRWSNALNPSMEFRCFVKGNQLKGICQRDCRTYFKHIQKNRVQIKEIVKEFYNKNLKERFFDSSYVFDIFIKKNNDILLLDFNPYGELTDSLLFDWDDLECDNEDDILFRCIESEVGVSVNEFAQYRVPRDFIDGLNTNADAEEIARFLEKQIEIQEREEKN